MPMGASIFRQWPEMAPSKRETADRHGSDNSSGSLRTLTQHLLPSASFLERQSFLAEVERQFALPRLVIPPVDTKVQGLLAHVARGLKALATEELRAATVTVRADMAWRWLRYERLFNPRPPRHERDEEFVDWLGSVRPVQVEAWAATYLRLGSLSTAEAALRLLRLRPMPLELLRTVHISNKAASLARYYPTDERVVLDYAISACLQRLDAYYLRGRLDYRRIQLAYNEVGIKSAEESIHGLQNGQLTISDAVFAEAERQSAVALERAHAGMNELSARLGVTTDPGQGSRTEGCAGQCPACRSGARRLARSPKNMRYPPFVFGCTCHYAFDWEGEPMAEADYEDELSTWAARNVRGEPYPFPARMLLFKLAEPAQMNS